MTLERSALCALLLSCASTPPPEPSEPSRAIVVAEPGTNESVSPAKPSERTPPRDPLAPSLAPPSFPSILFASSDPRAPAESTALLDEIVAELRSRPELILEVNGHIVNGEPQGLGFSRAKLVSNYLTDHGLDAKRIRIVDRGESDPVSPEPAQNRRVSFRPYEAAKP